MASYGTEIRSGLEVGQRVLTRRRCLERSRLRIVYADKLSQIPATHAWPTGFETISAPFGYGLKAMSL